MKKIPINLSLDQTWQISNGETLTTHEVFTKLNKNEIKKMLNCENETYEGGFISERFKIVDKKYGLLEFLGKGTFGNVHRCYDINDSSKKNYAIKIPNQSLVEKYESENISLGQLFNDEAVLTARLTVCENVVSIVKCSIKPIYLLLEYCNEGTLKAKLDGSYTKEDIYNWAIQISGALKVAHNLGYANNSSLVCRDLKPENILIANGVLKIADFGSAKMREKTLNTITTVGVGYTPFYASPEAFNGEFNIGVDIWSLGVILFQAISGKHPFSDETKDLDIFTNDVKTKEVRSLQDSNLKVEVDVIKLIKSCLEKNWRKRPSAEKINTFFINKVRKNSEKNQIDSFRSKENRRKEFSTQPQVAKNIDISKSNSQIKDANTAKNISMLEFKFLRNKTYSCGGKTHIVKEYRHKQTGMEFVRIPAGRFVMGREGGVEDQQPAHQVQLSSFLISKTVVTQGVWQNIIKTAPWKNKNYVKEGNNYPATYVSWKDAKNFCDQVNLNLPTEAQWEYACRSGSDSVYYWGDKIDNDYTYTWYNKNTCFIGNKYAHKVALKKANAFGLHDMSGNVWEWCADYYGQDYSIKSEVLNPKGPETGSRRVNRGGCWFGNYGYCRSRYRNCFKPSHRNYYIGFRLSVY